MLWHQLAWIKAGEQPWDACSQQPGRTRRNTMPQFMLTSNGTCQLSTSGGGPGGNVCRVTRHRRPHDAGPIYHAPSARRLHLCPLACAHAPRDRGRAALPCEHAHGAPPNARDYGPEARSSVRRTWHPGMGIVWRTVCVPLVRGLRRAPLQRLLVLRASCRQALALEASNRRLKPSRHARKVLEKLG